MLFIKKEVFQSFFYSLKLVSQSSKTYTYLSIIPTIIGSVFPLITIYLIKVIIDEVGFAIESNDPEASFEKVVFWIIIAACVFLIHSLSEAFGNNIREIRSQLFFDFIYKKIHSKTTSIDIEYFENDRYYDVFSRALENAHIRPLNVVNNAFLTIQHFVALLTIGGLILTLHKAVFIVLILASLPVGLIQLKYSSKLYKWYKKNTQNDRKTWDINDVLTNEYFASEVRLFDLKNYFIKLFDEIRQSVREGYIKIYKQKFIVEFFVQLIAAIAVFGAFGFITYQTVTGVITIGALTMYFLAIQKGVGLFNSVFGSIASLYEDSLYVFHLSDFLNLPASKKREDESKSSFPAQLGKNILFNNISFSYPDSKRNALKGITLEIPKGATVALVGPNGSGKTSLIKLLCKLYEPDSGSILVDGIDLKEIKNKEVRANVSVLFQNFARYNFTAKENIQFGSIDSPDDSERLKEAARKAQIHDFIMSLPNEYNTILGKIYPNSEELSVGQWQKIGLARAFYKKSQIVILDEPTASMDPDAEFEIFNLFKEITKDTTSIIVSHRFSTVQTADLIYVLNNGTVEEFGTHSELINRKGMYFQMFEKQAGYLR